MTEAEQFTIEYSLTDKELARATRTALLDSKVYVAILVALVVLGVVMMATGEPAIGILALVFVVSFSLLLLSPLTGRQLKRSNPSLREVKSWTFTKDRIEAKGTTSSQTWQWDQFDRMSETSGTFLLRVAGSHQFLAVPVRAFRSAGEAERFRDFARILVAAPVESPEP